jgi:hypothetical protein
VTKTPKEFHAGNIIKRISRLLAGEGGEMILPRQEKMLKFSDAIYQSYNILNRL